MSRRTLLGMSVVAVGGSLAANFTRPQLQANGHKEPEVDLERTIPLAFGDWRTQPGPVVTVNPQTQALLDKLYSQIVQRTYQRGPGPEQVMLSVSYGADQRGELEAHMPEVCYPAQGFEILAQRDAWLTLVDRKIKVRQLSTRNGDRFEPVTYWFTMGGHKVTGRWDKRIAELRLTLTGKLPDGLLFRVSSIDKDTERAWKQQERFLQAMLNGVDLPQRERLAGHSQE